MLYVRTSDHGRLKRSIPTGDNALWQRAIRATSRLFQRTYNARISASVARSTGPAVTAARGIASGSARPRGRYAAATASASAWRCSLPSRRTFRVAGTRAARHLLSTRARPGQTLSNNRRCARLPDVPEARLQMPVPQRLSRGPV